LDIENIRFRCPGCQHKLRAGIENVGALARCPRCNARTTVPHPSDPRALPAKPGGPRAPRDAASDAPPPGTPFPQEPASEEEPSRLGSVVFRFMVFAAVGTVITVLAWAFFWR